MRVETIIIGYAIGAVTTFILFWAFNIAKYCIEAYPEKRDFTEIVDYIFDDTDDRTTCSFVISFVWPITIPVFILFLIVLILAAIGSSLGILIGKCVSTLKPFCVLIKILEMNSLILHNLHKTKM